MFDKQTGEDSPPNEQQYFTHDRRYSTSENAPRFTDEPMNMESPGTQAQSQTLANPQKEAMSLSRLHSSRHLAQAGDLHTSAGLSDASKSLHRSLSTFTSHEVTIPPRIDCCICHSSHHRSEPEWSAQLSAW